MHVPFGFNARKNIFVMEFYLKFDVKIRNRHMRNCYFALSFLLFACNSDVHPVEVAKDYFPLRKGLYQIYKIEEERYSQGIGQFMQYEVRNEVVDSLPNPTGTHTYVIRRSKRETPNHPWGYLDTWAVLRDEFKVVQTENDTLFVKMAFPIFEGRSWDGNAFNTKGNEAYQMAVPPSFFLATGLAFAHTLEITQKNESNLLYEERRKEVYADGVGLVFKHSIKLNYCHDPACIGKQQIVSGIRYYQTIKEYGKL